MADILCGYTADRDETLTAYLFDDIEPAQRAAFEAHITTCERCRHELAELQGVRVRLREWSAPDLVRPMTTIAPAPAASASPRGGLGQTLRELPAWAQAAAALLVLGVSAGIGGAIANLDVRYDRAALTITTGWSRRAPSQTTTAGAGRATSQTTAAGVDTVPTSAAPATPWRTDLDALDKRLRTEFRALAPAGSPLLARTGAGPADAQLLRQVRALLDESERRQRNELALQIAEVVREFDTKRGTDLANIRSMKTIQSATGVEIVRQQQWLDLLTRASIQK